ncbi:MAG TPA: NUDIX hydrolase [Candidatus Acidoferrum sp.]|nr:NUDIX hydrolase [Candidatus Acidoferrum sp.]
MVWLAHSAVATVVRDAQGRFLIVEEHDGERVVFNQPAGHLDEGETLFTAAVRETLEETGWDVELTDLIGLYHYPAPNGLTYLRHCFAARPLHHHPERELDTPIIAAHWLTAEQILAPGFNARSPLVALCLRDYLAGKRYPLSLIQHLSP